jgi:DNA-binding HxlR family transcriptional regulator
MFGRLSPSAKETLDEVTMKWTITIVMALAKKRAARFNELRKMQEGISAKALADRLKKMEKLGLVTRRAYAEIPPRVEYALTEKGRELSVAVSYVCDWAIKWSD